MKNLATCKPSEFLAQTSKIRKSVDKWLKATDIMSIRKNLPALQKITPDMTEEERLAAIEENRRRSEEQVKSNAMRILEAVLDEHPKETLDLLALLCFIDPENVDNFPVAFYLNAFTEIINDEAVLNFFISLARLGSLNTSEQ